MWEPNIYQQKREQGAMEERERIVEICAGCLCLMTAHNVPNVDVECINDCKAHWLEYFGADE